MMTPISYSSWHRSHRVQRSSHPPTVGFTTSENRYNYTFTEIQDPADTDDPRVDIIQAASYTTTDRVICEISVRSGDRGLADKSRLGCNIDFDDAECDGRHPFQAG